MMCLRLSSKEEGQEQLQGHDWAGLETWGSLTSKMSGEKCADACLPGSSSRAQGQKEKHNVKRIHPLSWRAETGRCMLFPPLRGGLGKVEAGWVVGVQEWDAAAE